MSDAYVIYVAQHFGRGKHTYSKVCIEHMISPYTIMRFHVLDAHVEYVCFHLFRVDKSLPHQYTLPWKDEVEAGGAGPPATSCGTTKIYKEIYTSELYEKI